VTSTSRRIALLAVLLQASTACSLAMRTAPDPIVAPNEPVSCNDSSTAPVLDAICAGIFLSATISVARLPTCSSDPFNVDCVESSDKSRTMLVTGGLAALCTVGAAVGFKKASTCEQVKRANTLCIQGDEAACLKLNSSWKPPLKVPVAPEAAPAATPAPAPVPAQAGCAKDVDCKGDRVCEQGACVPPRVKAGN